MKPYYKDDRVTLYYGDCLESYDFDALETAGKHWLTADVLVTDPPYGTESVGWDVSYGRGQNRRHGRNDLAPGVIVNDATAATRDAVLALWGNRPALVFGSPRRPEPPGEWADRLVWDKKRPGMNGGPWRYRHESIFVTAGFVRRDNETTSVLTSWPDQSEHIHAKPLGLMTQLVNCAPPGVIADPFAGSGSTLVAASNLGRKAIGVEIEERYCELIAKRLDQLCLDFEEPA